MNKEERNKMSYEERPKEGEKLEEILDSEVNVMTPEERLNNNRKSRYILVHERLYRHYNQHIPERIHINFLRKHINTTRIVRRASLLEVFVKYIYFYLFKPNHEIEHPFTVEVVDNSEDCEKYTMKRPYYLLLKDLLSNRFIEATIKNNIKFFLRRNDVELARLFASRFANEYVVFFEGGDICLMPRETAYVDLYPEEHFTKVAIF